MTDKITGKTLPDTYINLVKEFPLTSIKDDSHPDDAYAMIERLLQMLGRKK